MKNKPNFFSIILLVIPIGLCLLFEWQLSGVNKEISDIKSQVTLINQIKSVHIVTPAKFSNQQVIVFQDQISKIQDFEDRRYNAITTQLNSFWSGVNGFLALIGIFFAMFSWYLTKQVESATKNIDELEHLKKSIDDYIEDRSFELYEKTIRQDISQIVHEVKRSKNQEAIKSAFDILKLRIKYIDIEDIVELYHSFNNECPKFKDQNLSYYLQYTSYYLVIMILKDHKKIPNSLIQELIDVLKSVEVDIVIQSFILLNDLCNADASIGRKLGNRIGAQINLKVLRDDMLNSEANNCGFNNAMNENNVRSINHVFEKWFGQDVNNEAE